MNSPNPPVNRQEMRVGSVALLLGGTGAFVANQPTFRKKREKVGHPASACSRTARFRENKGKITEIQDFLLPLFVGV